MAGQSKTQRGREREGGSVSSCRLRHPSNLASCRSRGSGRRRRTVGSAGRNCTPRPIRITASPTPHTPTKADSPKSPVIQPSLSTTPSAASEPAEQTDPHLTETTRRLSLMGLEKIESVAKTPTSKDADEVEEQEEVMLWRPKRGSIKLPHIELDPPAPSLLEQVSG
ncbi:hypothetical protein O3P69_008598 [Scylla paramamosain]|uniref:Uncharacterized protein n=1 Tax=Scylla paramamosain TaxID=85552 RepID=A0AAW0SKQ7_SCYPA